MWKLKLDELGLKGPSVHWVRLLCAGVIFNDFTIVYTFRINLEQLLKMSLKAHHHMVSMETSVLY